MTRPAATEPVCFAIRVGDSSTILDTRYLCASMQAGNYLDSDLRTMPITCKYLNPLEFRAMNCPGVSRTRSMLAAWRSPEDL